MRFWVSKNSEVPLREQLVRQVMLGIVSDDLKPGQRLPSTRELARRFRIHSNTVSAAYRDLERRGWIEFRKGSGVYVRALGGDALGEALTTRLELDQLISAFLSLARAHGFALSEIQERVKHWLAAEPPDHFLIIDPDEGLREILTREIEEATGARVRGAGFEACGGDSIAGAAVVAMYGQAAEVRAALPVDTTPILLRSRSVPESLVGHEPPPADALVAVVSRWPQFLEWARVVLVAAGLDPASLAFRDAREDGWQRAARQSAFVITDALTAAQIPPGLDARVYRIIADSSLEELRAFVERFFDGNRK